MFIRYTLHSQAYNLHSRSYILFVDEHSHHQHKEHENHTSETRMETNNIEQTKTGGTHILLLI